MPEQTLTDPLQSTNNNTNISNSTRDILQLDSTSQEFTEFSIDSDEELDVRPTPNPKNGASGEATKGTSFDDDLLKDIELFCRSEEEEDEETEEAVVPVAAAATSAVPVRTGSEVAASAPTQLLKKSVSATEDPLSGVWDTSTNHSNNNNATPPSQTRPPPPPPTQQSQQPILQTSHVLATSLRSSSPSLTNPIPKTPPSPRLAAHAKAPSATFSSTFSSLAAKVQDAVSSAAGTNLGTFPSGSVGSSLHPNPNSVLSNSPVLSSSSSVLNGGQGVRNTVYGSSDGMRRSVVPSVSQVASVPEMDTAQKTALLHSAIGTLLPGERVILFLTNLSNVRCSSSPHTGIGSPWENKSDPTQQDVVWCCAMTYYRIVVFNYHESDFLIPEGGGGGVGHEGTAASSQPMSAELKLWIQTASISNQYQQFQSTYLKPNGKRHHILEMPLAAIDRIGNSSEYTANVVSAQSQLSSLMGGTGFASSSSSSADPVKNTITNKSLVIYGKDNGRFLQFTASSYADCLRALKALNNYAFPGRKNLGYLFAFESRREEVMNSVKAATAEDGGGVGSSVGGGTNGGGPSRVTARATPRRYDALLEYQRMVGSQSPEECPWRPYLKANSSYSLCTSYPSIIFGPSSISDETPEGMRLLRETAAFRSGNRTITMTWASRFDGASLWRCAQPKVGLQGNRCSADEFFIKKISESSALANSQASMNGKIPHRPSMTFLKMLTGCNNESDLMLESFAGNNVAFNEKCMLKIFDLRPKSSAIANKTAGYGYENTSNYKNATLSFHGIGNIHAVRDAYQKISSLCLNQTANDAKWSQLVEDTNWLSQIRAILSASWQAAFHIRYNRLPIIVRCSHGWDRTSQVCALTQLFLDPYYRTRAGFSCLISKDFLALGHPFHTRCAHGEGRGEKGGGSSSNGQGDDGQVSPIFIQFLDCVFQIVNQFPEYFEFNTTYLLVLSEHVYSCRFGTLLCDTERERELVATIRQRTHCLWEYLDSLPNLINFNYTPVDLKQDDFEGDGALMMPLSTLLRNVTLWTDRHCMHGAKPTTRIGNISTEQTIPDHHDKSKEDALRSALEEAARWKAIATEMQEEIEKLKNAIHT